MAKKEPRVKKGKDPRASSIKTKLSFALGDMGCNFAWSFTSGFLIMYYTDSAGLSTAFVGTLMLLVRIFDGASDISMGMLIEKTNTRWGKARPWLLFFCVPFAVSLLLLFNVPSSFSDGGKQVYAYATYIFMAVICYTVINLAYNALLPRFSLTPHDRNVTSAFRGIAVIITALFISVATPSLLEMFGGQKSQEAWTTVATIYAAVSLVTLLITFFGVKERVPLNVGDGGKVEKVSIKKALRLLVRNKYFYIATLLFIMFYATTGLGSVGIFFARDVLGDANYFGYMSIALMLPMLIGTPMMPALYKRFGKRNVMLIGALIAAAACVVQLFFISVLPAFLLLTAIKGFGQIMTSASIFTLASDIVEYTDWKHGIRTEGLVTSVNSFGIKVGTGLGSGMVGWVLAMGGYEGLATIQSGSTINAMIALAVVIPLVFSLVMAVLLMFWDIDKYRPQIEEAMKQKQEVQSA